MPATTACAGLDPKRNLVRWPIIMRRIKDGVPMTKVNTTAPVSQTGQTSVARKISIPLIVMQQLTISTHKEAPLKFNFPACIPVPKK